MLFSSRPAAARRLLACRQSSPSILAVSTAFAPGNHSGPSPPPSVGLWQKHRHQQRRPFSTPPPTNAAPPIATAGSQPQPPTEVTEEMAFGVQDSTALFLRHGLGKRRLEEIAREAGQGPKTLVSRWQRMMEAFLGTQVHVLAGLGYAPNEQGIGLYNQQLAQTVQSAAPDVQEKIRTAGRDTWREVLSTAFNVPIEDIENSEMNIVDARNVMHKVAQKMQEPAILEHIARKCASLEVTDAKGDTITPAELQLKHTIVQETLVNQVYLGGEPSLVSECGFGDGERGYVLMQCVMAEHQSDPLVAQYIGGAMMQVLQSAGLDAATLQKLAEQERAAKGGGSS